VSPADTIAAIATPPGRGGIGVLRVSGPRARDIAAALCGDVPQPRRACLKTFRDSDGTALDRGLAIFFPAPASFTGEDVLELHAHGGPVLMDLLLDRALQSGARIAEPGEFTQRAFLNDKIDLVQAEAVADLIDSGSRQAARSATRSLQGEFSARARSLTQQLIETRMHVEAAIDFPEEEIDFLADTVLHRRLEALARSISETLNSAHQGALLREGMTIVIAGKPNAGKSSLLNALAGYDAAIVTSVPGTTRDVLRERIAIDGMPLHIIDTAGLRETRDVIETEGIKRTHREMAKADRILYVIDSAESTTPDSLRNELAALPVDTAVTLIYNKVDVAEPAAVPSDIPALNLSARTGAGLMQLRQHLKEAVGLQDGSATTFSARGRHLDALRRAQQHVDTAIRLLADRKAGELMAEELRLAQHDIGEITGEVTSDDLLGQIFAKFCIGK